jgi:hypothetical protein
MPLIRILSDKKREEYEQPPVFSAQERKHFFRLPASLQVKVSAFSSFTNQMGFKLMFGYFLAKKRFYPTTFFRQKDIRFLCGQQGAMPFAFDREGYKSSTYSRHRVMILEYFSFHAYQPKIHNPLVLDTIREQIYSWEDNELIVNYILAACRISQPQQAIFISEAPQVE